MLNNIIFDKRLNLDSNQLEQLPYDLLSNLKDLEQISLYNNQLKKI